QLPCQRPPLARAPVRRLRPARAGNVVERAPDPARQHHARRPLAGGPARLAGRLLPPCAAQRFRCLRRPTSPRLSQIRAGARSRRGRQMGQATGDWLSGYDAGGYYCELFGRAEAPATHTQQLRERLSRIPVDELRRRARNAENELFNLGVTFTVYSEK